jgi:hypothetical protein
LKIIHENADLPARPGNEFVMDTLVDSDDLTIGGRYNHPLISGNPPLGIAEKPG